MNNSKLCDVIISENRFMMLVSSKKYYGKQKRGR